MLACEYLEMDKTRLEQWLDAVQARVETNLEHSRAVIDECRRLILSMVRDREEVGKQD